MGKCPRWVTLISPLSKAKQAHVCIGFCNSNSTEKAYFLDQKAFNYGTCTESLALRKFSQRFISLLQHTHEWIPSYMRSTAHSLLCFTAFLREFLSLDFKKPCMIRIENAWMMGKENAHTFSNQNHRLLFDI
jgi:hypothetical protein